MSETINTDAIIGDLEAQFGPPPEDIASEFTMLDLLGVEVPPLQGNEVFRAPTASAFTDNKTGQGDSL